MQDTYLLLGPILFRDFEVASGIAFGGEQRLAVHKLPGGVRIVDALGRDDGEIAFSGIFTGSDATLRARALDLARAAGQVLPLTWDTFFYSVVLSRFSADYQNASWIPYRAICTVVTDEAAALIDTGISLASDVLTDLASGAGLALSGGASLPPLPDASTPSNFTIRGSSAYGAALGTVSSAQSAIGGAASQAEHTMLTSNAMLDGPASPAGASAALNAAAGAAGQLGQLAGARAYFGRAAVNLSNAST